MPMHACMLVCSTALGAMGVDAPGFAEGLAAAMSALWGQLADAAAGLV